MSFCTLRSWGCCRGLIWVFLLGPIVTGQLSEAIPRFRRRRHVGWWRRRRGGVGPAIGQVKPAPGLPQTDYDVARSAEGNFAF